LGPLARFGGARYSVRVSRALRFSRTLALLFGVLRPLGETIRKWGHVGYLPAFLDDFFIGAFLLWGAWASRRGDAGGRGVLCAAWGFTCGMGYASFFSHVRDIDLPDVGPLPQVWLTVLIGAGWVMSIVAMGLTLREARGGSSDEG
jgi:hypothetical protein